ncbi:alpha/beta fold hydrolase [Mycobacterium colombiense]
MSGVVLLHGLGSSPRAWARVLPLLSPHVDRILVPRLVPVTTLEDEARRVAVQLEQRPCVLVGHSMGGLVATALAEQYPNLVERLILINTPPTAESRISARGVSERLLRLPALGPALWRVMPDSFAAKGLASAFAPGFAVPEIFVQDLRATGLKTFLRSTDAIDTYLRHQALPGRLTTLACPTHALFGLRDQRVDPTSADAFRAVPHATVTTLPDAGHTPPWEAPSAVATAVLTPGG